MLNDCDTSWKGEAFITGWEIATGLWKWKYFPVGLLSLWAMGYSLWLFTRSVYDGFPKESTKIGIIDLGFSESELLEMEFEDLDQQTTRAGQLSSAALVRLEFLWWSLVSQLIFLFPLVLAIFGLALLIMSRG